MKDFEIRCDESRLETTNLIYGKFTLGPFLPGQATTFGNALRRSLLAELSGLAITAFEIIGVMQEFSTLPGLRESILDLSLNLKQIVLTGVLPHSTPPIGFLNVRGPAIIKAIDLKLPAGVYCASPTQYIATLGSNGMLHLKFVVSVGKGYSIQPYSIYRSLSKVKLQSASNFDNAILDQRLSLTRPAQAGDIDEFLKKSSKSTTIPVFRPQYNKETSSLEKSITFLSPEVIDKSSSFVNGLVNSKGLQSKEGVPSEINTQSKITDSSASCAEQTVGVKALRGTGVKTLQDTQELIRFTKQRSQGQALSYKASPSNFFTPGDVLKKNSNSSYINIQTQLFQRITPHQVLPIDAVFTPVSQVNFLTEVNDRFETARENIVLEIWTNGSIHPKRALEEATLSLVQNFDTLLKKIQQASSFYKGLRYWTCLQPFTSSLREKTDSFFVNSPASQSPDTQNKEGLSKIRLIKQKDQEYLEKEILLRQQEDLSITSLSPEVIDKKVIEILEKEPENLYESFEEKLLEKLFKKELPQSIYNLDIGNLNLSLQTFIFLKKAKIHTLLQLLIQFSLKQNNQLLQISDLYNKPHLELNFLNEKILEELNDVIRQFGSEN